MAIPQSYFTYHANGLNLILTNLSLGHGLSYLWDFGNGQTSTQRDITHQYAEPGFYKVSLTVSNDDGSSTFALDLQINATGVAGLRPIYFIVKGSLPAIGEIQDNVIVEYIRLNQLNIQPAIEPPIEDVEVHNESNYHPLVNQLISSMTILDIIILKANQYMASFSSTSSTEGAAPQVKSIETGPSKVEWYAGSEQWTEIMKPGGTYEIIRNSTCALAQRLNIQLPYCPQIPKEVFAIKVTDPRFIYVSPDNQFTNATEYTLR
jgi:PKD repeat protein